MKHAVSRRDVIGAFARWTCAAALGGLIWRLGLHTARRNGSHSGAGRRSACVRCPALTTCSLPQGIGTRAASIAGPLRTAQNAPAAQGKLPCPYPDS